MCSHSTSPCVSVTARARTAASSPIATLRLPTLVNLPALSTQVRCLPALPHRPSRRHRRSQLRHPSQLHHLRHCLVGTPVPILAVAKSSSQLEGSGMIIPLATWHCTDICRLHTNSHSRPFKCRESGCNQDFPDKKGRNRHEDAIHERFGPEKLHCPDEDCKEWFAKLRDDNLKRHIRSKHKERRDKLLAMVRDGKEALTYCLPDASTHRE